MIENKLFFYEKIVLASRKLNFDFTQDTTWKSDLFFIYIFLIQHSVYLVCPIPIFCQLFHTLFTKNRMAQDLLGIYLDI